MKETHMFGMFKKQTHTQQRNNIHRDDTHMVSTNIIHLKTYD